MKNPVLLAGIEQLSMASTPGRGDVIAAAFSITEALFEALALVPRHALARAGVAILDGPDSDAARGLVPDTSPTFELVMARAAVLVHVGDVPAAVAMVLEGLKAAPPGNTGWLIPIEPLLRVWEHRDARTPVLQTLHVRAR